MPDAEVILWSRLRRHPLRKFRRQHPIGPYIADFACLSARLVVEVDGGTHATCEEIEYNRIRDAYMRRKGWQVLRVKNNDIYRHLYDVLDDIERLLGAF